MLSTPQLVLGIGPPWVSTEAIHIAPLKGICSDGNDISINEFPRRTLNFDTGLIQNIDFWTPLACIFLRNFAFLEVRPKHEFRDVSSGSTIKKRSKGRPGDANVASTGGRVSAE